MELCVRGGDEQDVMLWSAFFYVVFSWEWYERGGDEQDVVLWSAFIYVVFTCEWYERCGDEQEMSRMSCRGVPLFV